MGRVMPLRVYHQIGAADSAEPALAGDVRSTFRGGPLQPCSDVPLAYLVAEAAVPSALAGRGNGVNTRNPARFANSYKK